MPREQRREVVGVLGRGAVRPGCVEVDPGILAQELMRAVDARQPAEEEGLHRQPRRRHQPVGRRRRRTDVALEDGREGEEARRHAREVAFVLPGRPRLEPRQHLHGDAGAQRRPHRDQARRGSLGQPARNPPMRVRAAAHLHGADQLVGLALEQLGQDQPAAGLDAQKLLDDLAEVPLLHLGHRAAEGLQLLAQLPMEALELRLGQLALGLHRLRRVLDGDAAGLADPDVDRQRRAGADRHACSTTIAAGTTCTSRFFWVTSTKIS